MAAILKKAYYGYKLVFDELVDPRVKSWPLTGDPLPGLVVLGLYLMFIFKWGPKFMQDRQPYNLNKILMVYNAFQVIACAHIFYVGIVEAWGWSYRWVCEPVDFTLDPKAVKIASYTYYYYLLKLLDLLDTVFFVLRKKYNQISFLHVYHHTGMVMLIWGASSYYPGGHGTLVGVINCFVHVVMYSYYLLTIAFPKYKQSMWWKKYITQLQIIQFLWCVIHFSLIVFKSDCQYPRWSAALFLPQNLFMLILFLDFYYRTYIKKSKGKATEPVKAKQEDDYRRKPDSDVAQSNGFLKVNSLGNDQNFRNIKLRS